MKVVSSGEMQRLDNRTSQEYGLSSLILMENAGRQTFNRLRALFSPLSGKSVLIVAGNGNNGGDGLVVARHLLEADSPPCVYLLFGEKGIKGDARVNLALFEKLGGKVINGAGRPSGVLETLLQKSDILVDAIFGTGLSRPVEETALEVIQKINASGKKVVSLDIPSGVSSDTGKVLGAAVRASYTTTYGLPKKGHYLFPGADFRGTLFVEEIGIPKTLLEDPGIATELLDLPLIRKIFPGKRARDTHKGTFGHLLVIAGSRGKRGAGALCCRAALRSGAGLVTWALPKSLDFPDASVPEAMTLPLPETSEGTLALSAEESLLAFAKDKDAVAIGPGLSGHPETRELIKRLVFQVNCPVILDADGIHALAGDKDRLKNIRGPVLLTPHPGEFGKWIGMDTQSVQQERMALLTETSSRYNCIILLKGAFSLLASPDGSVYINPTGNPGMATAGTGDVLTGIVGGFCVQGIPLPDAAKIGVFLHGLSGDLSLEMSGELSLMASDVIENIPRAVEKIFK